MSKGIFVGHALLNRFVALKSGVDPEVSAKVIQALDEVVLAQLQSGASVRMFGGFLKLIKTKATRRANPRVPGELVQVPAGERIVFRASRAA